jgi:glycosyltransferase involved in cell wall biosynthesis
VGDVGALAGKMIEVLAIPELRRGFVLRGKQRAAKFSWGNLSRMHIDAYKGSLGGS